MAASNDNNNYEVHCSGLFELPVLYHDAHIIIVNKPPGMLSVPGKEILTKLEVRPRSEQWHNVIRDVIESAPLVVGSGHKRKAGSVDVTEQHDSMRVILQRLLDKGENVPRKEDKFKRYLSRAMKVTDIDLQDKIYKVLVARDDEMHRIQIDRIPSHLLSAQDVASHLSARRLASLICHEGTAAVPGAGNAIQQQKVHAVHRLDMETSGVLLFAKDEHISAVLDKQFRERHVSHRRDHLNAAHRVKRPQMLCSALMLSLRLLIPCRWRRCTWPVS
jgi:hypothetical protein